MCRHILNAKVFIQASCCNNWFDCFECHDEACDHPFKTGRLLRMTCKSCRRVFQKDVGLLMERDKFCENCGVQWCIPGVTPESVVYHEGCEFLHQMMQKVVDEAGHNLPH